MQAAEPIPLQERDDRILPPLPIPRWALILILGALSTVSPFSIDMYLPAFGGLAEALHTSVAKVGLSVSSYFIGLAIGQVFYGPLLDRFGRKKPLAFGLGLYVAATRLRPDMQRHTHKSV